MRESRPDEEPELVDPAAKTQPAEGGREEAEDPAAGHDEVPEDPDPRG